MSAPEFTTSLSAILRAPLFSCGTTHAAAWAGPTIPRSIIQPRTAVANILGPEPAFTGRSGRLPANRKLRCAVQGAGPQWVQFPPGNWIAPPGSNRSSRGGNESAGAFGVKSRVGDLAIMQAVMEVNAEQAPKPVMQSRPAANRGKAAADGKVRANQSHQFCRGSSDG